MRKYLISGLVLLIIVGTFFDYQISNQLFISNTFFGEIVERIGALPSYILATISLFILIKTSKNRFIIVGLYLTNFLVICYFMKDALALNTSFLTSILVIALTSLIIIIIEEKVFRKIDKITLLKYRQIAINSFIFFLLLQFGVQIIKVIWARPRFYSLNSINEFIAWYHPHPYTFDDAFMSFISGHTANASAIIMLSVFTEKKRQWFIFSAIWIVIVAMGRIVNGNHFLTDVSFAFVYTYILFRLFTRKL